MLREVLPQVAAAVGARFCRVPEVGLEERDDSLRGELDLFECVQAWLFVLVTLTHHDRFVDRVIENAHTFRVRQVAWKGSSKRTQQFTAESTLTGFLKLVRVYCANARPLRVRCAYPAPPYAAEYARVFGTNVEFDQPHNELELEHALLDAPSPHADSDMFDAQRVIAERRLVQVTHDAPYAVRVREHLIGRFPARVNMGCVAQALGLSERSLRQQLAEEGTSYREVEHAALGMLARELLQDPRRTIQETAYEMGFSDAATFHRAVKRWTGQTPSALRGSGRDVVEPVDLSQRGEEHE
jgi:AraC-like DNA-binding protein